MVKYICIFFNKIPKVDNSFIIKSVFDIVVCSCKITR